MSEKMNNQFNSIKQILTITYFQGEILSHFISRWEYLNVFVNSYSNEK